MKIEDIIEENILDEQLINYVERRLHEKGINIETQDEVIKYLWANKKLFGHILDTKKVADRIIENLDKSIVYFGTDTSNMPELYKSRFNVITSILSMMIVGGYYQPYSKEVYLNPLVQGKSTKRRRMDRESIFMHELDHCATTSYVDLSEVQKGELISYNANSNIFKKILQKINPKGMRNYFKRKIKRWDDMTNGKAAIVGINDPILSMKYNVSLVRLNEGITVLKQKMYSDALGLSFNKVSSSTYLAEPFVAEFVAKKIGLDNLIKLQQDNDYEGMRRQFIEATGQDLNDLVRDLNKIPMLVPVPERILKKKLKLEKYDKKDIVSNITRTGKDFVPKVTTPIVSKNRNMGNNQDLPEEVKTMTREG